MMIWSAKRMVLLIVALSTDTGPIGRLYINIAILGLFWVLENLAHNLFQSVESKANGYCTKFMYFLTRMSVTVVSAGMESV